jgi:hypothetical protein
MARGEGGGRVQMCGSIEQASKKMAKKILPIYGSMNFQEGRLHFDFFETEVEFEYFIQSRRGKPF